ncbi:MAG: hypothetical protein V4717_11240 [Bacteroidota bacterium]
MNPEQLTILLATITGHLHANNKDEEVQLDRLMETLGTTLLHQEPETIRNESFAFERSDLFFTQNLEGSKLDKIKNFSQRLLSQKPGADLRIFIRDKPIRTTQVAGSVPSFAAGARLHETIGPFRNTADGRLIFVDVFRVVKLIAIYQQGQTLPALLFSISTNKFALNLSVSTKYTLVPNTVYIRSGLLGSGAPDNYYCGLRIKKGTIILSAAPQLQNNKLVIENTTTVQVQLQLDQAAADAGDVTSPYGVDARNMSLLLPETFHFNFTGNNRQYTTIGNGNWNVYGSQNQFTWGGSQAGEYNPLLSRVAIPMNATNNQFEVQKCESPFCTWTGKSTIFGAGWFLNAGAIDIIHPLEAAGNGAYAVLTEKGLECSWQGLEGGGIDIVTPFIMAEPGRISVTDLVSNASGCSQQFELWADEANRFGSQMLCKYKKQSAVIWNTLSKGDEAMLTMADTDCKIDRPVKTNGEPVKLRAKNSLVMLAASKTKRLVYVVDINLESDNPIENFAEQQVQDYNKPLKKLLKGRIHALALHNALLTTTPPKAFLLFGESNETFSALSKGQLFIQFGLFSYIPTLPDPYAANLGILKNQYTDWQPTDHLKVRVPAREWLWLTAKIKWNTLPEAPDKVGVSFHFSPKPEDGEKLKNDNDLPFLALLGNENTQLIKRDYEAPLKMAEQNPILQLGANAYALLDVSSRANQMGVSFGFFGGRQKFSGTQLMEVHQQEEGLANAFPLQIRGMDMVTYGFYARAFAMPQIAWEPVMNTTPNAVIGDPPFGWNYYENDGVPAIIGNQSNDQVPLSPIPMVKFLEQQYQQQKDGATFALFNLPFGMLAGALLSRWKADGLQKPNIENLRPDFGDNIHGGIQLELTAGSSFYQGEDNLFQGISFQLENINDLVGNPTGSSTLGNTVRDIYNNEFQTNTSSDPGRPGVPVKRIGLSGYGASLFTNWLNKDAAIAEVSQAMFNAAVGRTSHEVIQVKSILYPWGIKVVRTITLYRLSNGYVIRVDSGWRAESNGLFDFSYKTRNADGITTNNHENPYDIHPGIIRGLYNVRNIRENGVDYNLDTTIKNGDFYIEANMANSNYGKQVQNTGANFIVTADLRGLTFDADVAIENLEQGGSGNKVPSKGVMGWVQVAPKGVPISAPAFADLLAKQKGSIGGAINCVIKMGGTAQRMQLSAFDVNKSINAAGNAPVFSAAGRGSLMLPKDGSWTMVKHERGSGEVTPLPEGTSIPIIREGLRNKNYGTDLPQEDPAAATKLLRVANPMELLRMPNLETINFGILQNVDTQKVLFLTPAFNQAQKYLLSKTPPLMSDAYRLLNTKGIFPNSGDAETNFGTAIQLLKGIGANHNPLDAFNPSGLTDAGKQAFQLLEIKAKEEAGKLLEQGYKLVKNSADAAIDKVFKFDLPSMEYPIVDITGLKIFIEYKAGSKNRPPEFSDAKFDAGKLDFDIDTFGDQAKQIAGDLKETWKSRMNNIAMVVNLGPIERLMTIKGNFNSSKGKSTDFGSKSDDDSGFALPTPEIQFKEPELSTIIQVLEVLAALSTGKYADAVKNGLKIAMSNSANLWEYKFEATKDIPVLRFPPMPEYNNAQIPFKLEAGMGLGVYFNAALKVTSDPTQLLPTAGAFFRFHAGMQVMVVSVAAASVFAVGQVDLEIAADTSPLISLRMKFGFGANLVVGLPVVGNVSIMFLVGVEIYVDSTKKMIVTAFMLFRGQAELLGGIVSVTITIEAKGSVERLPGADQPCNCQAQVTFAIDISIFLVINISFSESWEETRQIS